MSDIEHIEPFLDIGYTSDEEAARLRAARHSGVDTFSNYVSRNKVAKRPRRGMPAIGEESALLGIEDHAGLQDAADKERAIKHGGIREQFVIDDIWSKLLLAEEKGDRRAVALALVSFDKRYKRSVELGREPAQPTIPGLDLK